jgi:hypothetical protein
MPFQRVQISELLWSTQMKDFSAMAGTTDVLGTRIMVTVPYIVCITADRHFSQESPTTCSGSYPRSSNLIRYMRQGDCTKDLYYLLRFLFSGYQYYQYY